MYAALSPFAGVAASNQRAPQSLCNQGLAWAAGAGAGAPAAKGSAAMPVIFPGLMSSGMPRAASICCLSPASRQQVCHTHDMLCRT